MSITVKNRLPQAVPTLVYDEADDQFTEKRVPPREKMEIPEPLSALTESQITNGILKKLTPKTSAPAGS